jgi:hypothetical protein
MAEAAGIGQIAKSVRGVEQSTTSFKQAATEGNRNVTKVVKDIGGMFSSLRRELNSLTNTLSDSATDGQQTASKVNNTNSLLQESIALQGSMLAELKNIRMGIRALVTAGVAAGGQEGGGGVAGALSGGAKAALGVSAAALGAAATGAGYLVGGGQKIPPPVNFAGTEEQKVDAILQTIKGKESGGNYGTTSFAEGKGSSASGGYQFTDSTWKRYAEKFGVDTKQYPRAKDAPPELQDEVARRAVKEILIQVKGDVSKVPLVWYTGNPEGKMSANALAVNRGYTAERYQKNWTERYNKTVTGMGLAGGAEAASRVDTTPTQTPPAATRSGSTGGATSEPTGSSGGAQTPNGGSSGSGHAEAVKKGVQPGIAGKLKEIESAFGGSLSVTSGHRDQAHNARVGGAENSAHTRGNAVDVKFNGGIPETIKLIEAASKAGIGGIGVYGPGSVHLDTENRRAWGGSYKRESVPKWAENAIRAHETGQWGNYDPSARGGDATQVGAQGRNLETMGMDPKTMMSQGGSMSGMGMGGPMGGGNPLMSLGMMMGGRGGAMLGLAGMLLPAISGIMGSMGGDSEAQPQTAAVPGPTMRDAPRTSPAAVQPAMVRDGVTDRRAEVTREISQTAVRTEATRQTAEAAAAAQPNASMPENAPMPPPRPQSFADSDQKGVYSDDGNNSWVSAIRNYVLNTSTA